MYPVGIRVVKVAGIRNIGMTGVVVGHFRSDVYRDKDYDLEVAYDHAAAGNSRMIRPPGFVFVCASKNWRPINPDADEITDVTEQELEKVL